mmetsp:Transcript_4307/g.5484  ORF Transcript_4307/g.5484 Transcript_4307/m.5484 type:complete len:187 (-) Transcript_4307:140-700(-)
MYLSNYLYTLPSSYNHQRARSFTNSRSSCMLRERDRSRREIDKGSKDFVIDFSSSDDKFRLPTIREQPDYQLPTLRDGSVARGLFITSFRVHAESLDDDGTKTIREQSDYQLPTLRGGSVARGLFITSFRIHAESLDDDTRTETDCSDEYNEDSDDDKITYHTNTLLLFLLLSLSFFIFFDYERKS